MTYRLAELAEAVEGTVRGDGDLRIEGIQSLAEAGTSDIAFLTHASYRKQALSSHAGAIVLGKDDEELGDSLVICPNPALAVVRIVRLFHPEQRPEPSIHATAAPDRKRANRRPDPRDPGAQRIWQCVIGGLSFVQHTTMPTKSRLIYG